MGRPANENRDSGDELVMLFNAEHLKYWTERLDTTEGQLRTAVREVGQRSDMVRLYLNRRT